MTTSRIYDLPNYLLSRPIPIEIYRVPETAESHSTTVFRASAKNAIELDIEGEGHTLSEAIEDMARIIENEYKFFSRVAKPSQLRGFAKRLYNNIDSFIESERKAA